MKETLIQEFEETTIDLGEVLGSFTQEEFNKVPFEGSWTAGQVAEHLFKSESNIPKVLTGNSKETSGDPFEKTGLIRSVFRDFSKKMKSPEFILPSDEPKNKDYFMEGFERTRKELRSCIHTIDLSRTFTGFTLPQIGQLTGWEWICFAVTHSRRHIRQMKNIAERLQTLQPTVDDAV